VPEDAQALFISRHTRSDHMKAIIAKLGVSGCPELTALDQAPANTSSGGC
jgi:DNA-binding CsgD family transcriptional regulator